MSAPRTTAALGLAAAAAAALAACAGSPAPAPAPAPARAAHGAHAHAGTGHGVHGMVMFGRGGRFASHLPLYRAPHAAQVVLEVELADPALGAAYARELDAAPLVTFEPDAFDLGALAPGAADPPRAMTGTIYRGHFERGGAPWRRGVALAIRRVVVFHGVDPAPPARAPGPPRYHAFGAGDETYLLRRIDARPGCDRIVAVGGPAPAATVELADDAAPPAPAGGPPPDPCTGPSEALLARHGWRAPRVVYEERDDLR